MVSAVVLVVGGDRAPHGLDALAARLGASVEWVEGTTRKVESAARRVQGGSVAALVVLDGYLAHRTFGVLLAVARGTGTPFAYAGRGSKAAVAAAGEAVAAALGARRVA
jgi:hypothetical protein